MTDHAENTRTLLAELKDHLRAYDSIKAMAEVIGSGNDQGLRIKCNTFSHEERVVLVSDLDPKVRDILFVQLEVALDFHNSTMGIITATLQGTPVDATQEAIQDGKDVGPALGGTPLEKSKALISK